MRDSVPGTKQSLELMSQALPHSANVLEGTETEEKTAGNIITLNKTKKKTPAGTGAESEGVPLWRALGDRLPEKGLCERAQVSQGRTTAAPGEAGPGPEVGTCLASKRIILKPHLRFIELPPLPQPLLPAEKSPQSFRTWLQCSSACSELETS